MLPWQTGSEPFSVMTQQQLYEWITHPELLNRDTLYELRTLLARYPYFQTVRLLYLKNLFLLHDITFGEELRKAALYVADRKVLFYLIEGERFIISPLDKQEKPKEEGGLDRTLSLIDAFLSSLPEDSAAVELPMDVTADFIQSSINSFGSTVMAGSTAAANIEGFVYTAMNAFYQTALSFTGQNMGAKKYDRVAKILRICILCALNSYFVRNSVGSTVSSLRMDIFQKAEIKLPPIPKQQHICKIIDAFCTKLEVEQSIISTLQELKQFLLSQMFI